MKKYQNCAACVTAAIVLYLASAHWQRWAGEAEALCAYGYISAESGVDMDVVLAFCTFCGRDLGQHTYW